MTRKEFYNRLSVLHRYILNPWFKDQTKEIEQYTIRVFKLELEAESCAAYNVDHTKEMEQKLIELENKKPSIPCPYCI